MILFLLLDRMERFWKSLGVMLWHSRNRMVLLFRVEGCGLPLKRGVIQPGILLHLLLYWKWGRERLCVFRPFLSHTAGRLLIINCLCLSQKIIFPGLHCKFASFLSPIRM